MNVYLGLFLTSFSVLALEITLSRLLSVITWYHLAFFAISTAMLGMTAAATKVYLSPKRFQSGALDMLAARASMRYALSVPLMLIFLCMLPLQLQKTAMSPIVFLVGTVACAFPFYQAGIVTSLVITKYDLPMGRLYASDLVGAALGCLFVLGGLEIFDAPSLILLCGMFGIPAAMCFSSGNATRGFRRVLMFLLAVFVVLPFINGLSMRGIRPMVVKGAVADVERELIEEWNSFSRVVVYKGEYAAPRYWGPSPLAPHPGVYQYRMDIDGMAGTVMWRFEDMDDIEPLRYDVTNVGYYLDRPGKVCVIGVGAGRDVQSAILFGHNDVVGVEVNPIFVDLLAGGFRDFARLSGRQGIKLVVDDARSYLTRSEDTFSVIQMSLIDTWAATGAGAFSLTENALYTLEAWTVFLRRLADNGFLTVSRWHSPESIGETGRVISLAIASLLTAGVKEPAQHLALITADRISTLLVSRRPFGVDDIARLRTVCDELRYKAAYLPGEPVADPALSRLLHAKSLADLKGAVASQELNYEPPTDESPYFFNMLRLCNVGSALDEHGGVLSGNLTATFTLTALMMSVGIVALGTIVVPLALRSKLHIDAHVPRSVLVSGAVYFSLIGAGFMFLEIALIQKLSLFLGRPAYALGILLFTLIASAGIGSLLSDALPLHRKPTLIILPFLTTAAVLGVRYQLAALLVDTIAAPLMNRIMASVLLIFPLGLLMGCFFPTGMILAKRTNAGDTPWFWALNGVFGVLCSVLAVFLSIYSGISTNFYIAAACYAVSAVCLMRMRSTHGHAHADRTRLP